MRTIKHTAFFTALLLLAGIPAQAETVLQYSPVQASADGAGSGTQTIFIRNGKIRMETTTGGKTQVTLFNQATQSFTALNDERRTYMVIDKNFSNNMQQRVQDARSQAMAKMKKRLQGMSPERRSLIESAMTGRMQQAKTPAKTSYSLKDTGKTEKIHGIPCRTVLAYKGRQVKTEMCVATIQALNMSQADYRTLLAMQDFMAKMSSGMMQGSGILPGGETLGGVPVRIRNMDSHQGAELSRVSHDPLPDGSFQIPAGYSPMRMPGPGAHKEPSISICREGQLALW